MTKFKDALDYIFIANDSGNSSYLIASTTGSSTNGGRSSRPSSSTANANASNHNATANASYSGYSSLAGSHSHSGAHVGSARAAAASHRMTSAISATAVAAAATVATTTATAAAAIMGSVGLGLGPGAIDTAPSTTTGSSSSSATTALSALATLASDAGVAQVAENLYSGVAVGLGAMLINDSLLLDLNETSLIDDIVNGSDLMANATGGNATASGDEDLAELLQMAATSVVLGLMILITIIGNVFVIAAIILERNLQNVANYLVASLAVADLFVACLVMPLGAVYEISQGWILGPELCDIWTSCDVLCCTASILHLVAIAVDRYWAVTNIDYIHSRTSRRVFLMIFCVWTAAVIVSLAPQFGWKDPDYLQRIEQQKCMVSQDVAYQVFATCCTFYVPLLVILVLYWKIYQTARKRIHRRRPRPIDVTGNNNQPDLSAQKKRKRLRLRIGKFSAQHSSTAGTTLGLVEGNSTNTVNTVEDTEFSSSNVDSKSRAGVEVTTVFTNSEEIATTSTSQISTVSHLVALANQQHAASKSSSQHPADAPTATAAPTTTASTVQPAADNTAKVIRTAKTKSMDEQITPPATAAAATKVCIVVPNESNGITSNNSNAAAVGVATGAAPAPAPTAAVNGGTEVLEDPQLQQQLQQVQQQADATTAMPKTGAGGTASASNATTITSISALSPQTPTTLPTATAAAGQHPLSHPAHQLGGSTNASGQATPLPKPKNQQQPLASIANPMHKVTKRKETLEAKRERKAAKTLAIITGAFVVCWLPFFVMALMLPLCAACQINDGVASLFLWLGYFNSTLNPVIYTIFSPEFRQAFKRILFGGHRPMHYRSGKI